MSDTGKHFDKASGTAKEKAGEMLDDESLEAEGAFDKAKGQVRDKAESLKEQAKDKAEEFKDEAQDKAEDAIGGLKDRFR